MRSADLVLLLGIAATAVPAQSSASPEWFVAQSTFGGGGTVQSAQHVLRASSADRFLPVTAQSPTFVLAGGFLPSTSVAIGSAPWLSGVSPPYATLRGNALLSVFGTELDRTPLSLTIGTQSVAVNPGAKSLLLVRLPIQTEPGWKPIEVAFGGARSLLSRGVGVLPLLDAGGAVPRGRPFRLELRASRNDTAVFAFATGVLPQPLPISNLGYGLLLDPAGLFASPALTVTDGDGVLRLDLPAITAAAAIFGQAVVLSSNAGYSPGSFTNLTRI
jgi:hypothetical protein